MKEALGEQDLAVALCLLMAQQKHCVVYRETDRSHLKLVGKKILKFFVFLFFSLQLLLMQFKVFFSNKGKKSLETFIFIFFFYQFVICLYIYFSDWEIYSIFLFTGKLYDQCQDTLVQFGTFLGSTMTVDEYVEKLPSIHSMLQDHHIHSDVAFFLARPMNAHAINVSFLFPIIILELEFVIDNFYL